MRVSAEHAPNNIRVRHRNRAVRVQEHTLDAVHALAAVRSVIAEIVVDLQGWPTSEIASTDEIIKNLVGGYAVKFNLVVEIRIQPDKVQHNAVPSQVAIDSQHVPIRCIEPRYVEHAVSIAIQYAGARIDGCGVLDIDVRSRLGAERSVEAVHCVERVGYRSNTVVDSAGNNITGVVVTELSRIRGREVDPAVDRRRSAIGGLSGQSHAHISVHGHIRDLERIRAGPLKQ